MEAATEGDSAAAGARSADRAGSAPNNAPPTCGAPTDGSCGRGEAPPPKSEARSGATAPFELTSPASSPDNPPMARLLAGPGRAATSGVALCGSSSRGSRSGKSMLQAFPLDAASASATCSVSGVGDTAAGVFTTGAPGSASNDGRSAGLVTGGSGAGVVGVGDGCEKGSPGAAKKSSMDPRSCSSSENPWMVPSCDETSSNDGAELSSRRGILMGASGSTSSQEGSALKST